MMMMEAKMEKTRIHMGEMSKEGRIVKMKRGKRVYQRGGGNQTEIRKQPPSRRIGRRGIHELFFPVPHSWTRVQIRSLLSRYRSTRWWNPIAIVARPSAAPISIRRRPRSDGQVAPSKRICGVRR